MSVYWALIHAVRMRRALMNLREDTDASASLANKETVLCVKARLEESNPNGGRYQIPNKI